MARYGKQHKEATRRRIIESAGRRFKQDGIAGSGIATLMADAGLTNGAFYAHFASKDDLVAATVADELRRQRERFNVTDRAGVEKFVHEYLSVEHRDNPRDGCPSAALVEEVVRCAEATQRAYTEGALAIVDDIATCLSPDAPHAARQRTLSALAMMIGTLQLSRALADRRLSDQILADGVHAALVLLGLRDR